MKVGRIDILLQWLNDGGFDLGDSGYAFVMQCCGDQELDCDELENLSGIVEEYAQWPHEFREFVEEKVVSFMEDFISDLRSEIDPSDFGCEYGEGIPRDGDWDIYGAKDWFRRKMDISVDSFYPYVKTFAQSKVDDLVNSIDIRNLFNDHANGVSGGFDSDLTNSDADDSDDAIHDLFLRG